jgi:hypothetical protein
MNSPFPGSQAIALFILIVMLITTAGCSERFASYDILVSKFDTGGHTVWSTKIGSEKQDFATAIIETSDGDYVIAGWISDKHGDPVHPRIIRLNGNGGTRWDRTFDATEGEAVAIAEAKDGGFVVAQFIDTMQGKVFKIDGTGRPVWDRTFNYSVHFLIPTSDGGYAGAGSHTFGLDRNGTLLWDLPDTSTSILPASDGGFFVERSGVPENYGTLFRLDAQGTPVWTQPVGSHAMGKITSLHETPEGSIEIVYTYPDSTKNKDIVMYMESEQVTLGKNGTATNTVHLVAVDPLVRTSDGGYAFAAYPFPESSAFTTLPYANSELHIVRLSPEGTITWDKSPGHGPMTSAESILQTRDGGFVTLVLSGS